MEATGADPPARRLLGEPPLAELPPALRDELCARGRLEGPTRDALQATWTREQQLEILALAGNYHTVSFVANVSEIEPEPWAAHFPT